MVTLARNLDLLGSRFLTGLTAVFVARLRQAPAWQVRTLFCSFVVIMVLLFQILLFRPSS